MPRCVYSSLAHIGAVPSLCHFQRHAYRRASRNLRVEVRPLARPSILPAISIETASPSSSSPPVNQRPRCSARITIIHPPLAKEGKKREKRREREGGRERKKNWRERCRDFDRFAITVGTGLANVDNECRSARIVAPDARGCYDDCGSTRV